MSTKLAVKQAICLLRAIEKNGAISQASEQFQLESTTGKLGNVEI